MTAFKIDTGVSVFSIYTRYFDQFRGYTVSFGDDDNLVNVSVSNSGKIIDVECIYAKGICQDDLELPDLSTLGRYDAPYGPSDEDEGYRWSLWLNLHPRKRELDIILYTRPLSKMLHAFNPRPENCYKDGRVEFYYRDDFEYDEDNDEFNSVTQLNYIRVLDLADEEYAYLKQFT